MLWDCGAAVLRPGLPRRAGLGIFVVLGLALGLGWWASPEIGYFALPCLVLLAAWWWAASRPVRHGHQTGDREPTRGRWRSWSRRVGLVGSLPWWYANAHTGFASVNEARSAERRRDLRERLSVFFHYMLPMQLGVRTVLSGSWVGGPTVGKLLYGVLLA